jgi:hypothetical protein
MSILVLHPSIPRVLDELPGRFPTRVEHGTAPLDGVSNAALAGIRAIVCAGANQVDRTFIDRFENLEMIANFGVGYDSVDAVYAASRGIYVTHTPDVLTEEVADTAMDYQIGDKLKELDDAGLREDTIVFYWSDHGSGLPRAMRWLYESGTRAALVVRVPERFRQPIQSTGRVDPCRMKNDRNAADPCSPAISA